MNRQRAHIDVEVLQSLVEGELEERARPKVEAHLQGCARCAAEMEGWRLLFEELRDLPALEPSARFRERVLERLPLRASQRAPFWTRVRQLLPGVGRQGSGHLSPARAQDFLEGLLPAGVHHRVEAHLSACAECAREVSSWSGFLENLSEIPRFRPSVGFGEGVLRELRERTVPAAVRSPRWPDRLRAAIAALVPSTRGGRAVAAGVLTAPVLGLVALFGAVLAHPLLGPLELVAFLSWRTSDLLRSAFEWAMQHASGSRVLLQAASIWEALFSSPAVAVSLLGAVWLTTMAAAWILYRNVVAPSLEASRHVRASS